MKNLFIKRRLAFLMALSVAFANPVYARAAQDLYDGAQVFEEEALEEESAWTLEAQEEAELTGIDEESAQDPAVFEESTQEGTFSGKSLTFREPIYERAYEDEESLDGAGTEDDNFEVTIKSTDKVLVDRERSQMSRIVNENNKSGGLSLSATKKSLQRDYDQYVTVRVRNTSEQSMMYYLECTNPYDDIYMDFILNGSKDAPLVINPGENQEVELNVFAQNAQQTDYTIAVTAHIQPGDKSVATLVNFTVGAPAAEVSITPTGIQDPVTLAQAYVVKNTGTGAITDLTMKLDGVLSDCARISPGVENYELKSGGQVSFKVIPDLGKLKSMATVSSDTVNVSGNLVAAGGAKGTLPVELSVSANKIVSTTMGELGLELDGNPFKNLAFDDNTLSFNTAAGGKNQNFTDITARYYDTKDPAKDGVNTSQELKEVIDTIIDDKGQIDFSIDDTLTYEENGTLKSVPTKVRISTTIVDGAEKGKDGADGSDEDTYVYVDENGNLVTVTRWEMSYTEYKKFVENINQVKDAVSVEKWDDFVIPEGEGKKVVVEITNSIEETALNLPKTILENPNTYVDISKMSADEFYQTFEGYQRYADSAFYTTYSTLGKTFSTITNVTDGVMMVADTARVWNNPNATSQQKMDYAGIQLTRACVKYFGAELLAKGGAAVGSAVADGPGAIVGVFLGGVIGALIDYQLSKELENIENGINGNANYFDIFGRQCTNVGSVTSVFYLPDDIPELPDIHETGRMYDNNRTDYYVNRERVGYDYYINDKKVPGTRSENDGLTQITYVDLTPGKDLLVPGENTIKRDYDTNPGTHYVVAETEITTIYPSDTPVNYVDDGTGKKPVEEVRLMPDFSVYKENIVVEGEPIVNEANSIRLDIFNRGSKEGWVNISLTDGNGSVIGKKDKVFLKAFSGGSVSFNWTPKTLGDIDLICNLTNAGLLDSERKTDNNQAQTTVTIREREVPQVTDMEPKEVYVYGKDDPVYISAELENIRDLEKVSISTGGKDYTDLEISRTGSDKGQVHTCVSAGSVGEHEVTITLEYASAPGTTQKLEVKKTLVVKYFDEIKFFIDETIKSPSFYLTGSSTEYANVTITASECSIKKNKSVQGNEDAYGLMVICDDGILYQPLNTLSGSVLSLNGGTTVSVSDNRAGNITVDVSNVTVDKGGSTSSYYPSLNHYLPSTFVIKGAEKANIRIRYKVFNSYHTTSGIAVDLLSGDKVIQLSELYKVYDVVIDDGVESNYFYYGFEVKKGEEEQYMSYSETRYDREAKTFSVLVADNSYVKRLNEATSVSLNMGSNSELFRADLTGYKEPVHVSRALNRNVTISYNGTGECVVNQSSLSTGDMTVSLYGKELSMPAGTYDITVSYREDKDSKYHIQTLDLTQGDAVITITGVMQDFGTIIFDWPSVLGTSLSARCYYTDKESKDRDMVSDGITRGEKVPFPVGSYTLNIDIRKYDEKGSSTGYYSFSRPVEVTENGEQNVTIGDVFEGETHLASSSDKTRKFMSGDSVRFSLGEIKDVSGNNLTYISDTNGVNGEFILSQGIESYSSAYGSSYLSSSFYGSVPEDVPTGEYDASFYISGKTMYFKVSTKVEGSGSITPKSVRLKKGGSQTFTITPDEGWHISDVQLDGKSVGKVTAYTISDISADHELKAVFKEDGKKDDPEDPEKDKDKDHSVSENENEALAEEVKITKNGKTYVLSFTDSGNKSAVTVAKGNKFVIDGGTKGSFRTGQKKLVAVNKKGIVKAKKPTNGTPVEITFDLNGKQKTLLVNVIEPSLSVSGNGMNTKKLKAEVSAASKGGLVLEIPSYATCDLAAAKIKGEITGIKIKSAGENKLYITFKASGKGSAKLPFMVNGKKFIVKIVSK